MVDAASRMECSQCQQIFFTTVFYDHIMQQSNCAHKLHQIHSNYNDEFTLCLEEESMINNNPVIYESNANFH